MTQRQFPAKIPGGLISGKYRRGPPALSFVPVGPIEGSFSIRVAPFQYPLTVRSEPAENSPLRRAMFNAGVMTRSCRMNFMVNPRRANPTEEYQTGRAFATGKRHLPVFQTSMESAAETRRLPQSRSRAIMKRNRDECSSRRLAGCIIFWKGMHRGTIQVGHRIPRLFSR